MKPFASLLTFVALLAALPAMADTYNNAHNVQQGYVDTNALTTSGTDQGVGYLNDGLTATGSESIFGAGYPASGGFDPNAATVPVDYFFKDIFFGGQTIFSINLYSALWSDGGWFGTSGVSGVDSNGKIIGADLVIPTFQYTTDGTNWITVGTSVNTYVASLSGQTVSTSNGFAPFGPPGYAPGISVESTFTLDTPITGAAALRLVGPGGGSDSFISGYEMEVIVPEPSTYAMLFFGLGMLVLMARLRRQLSA